MRWFCLVGVTLLAACGAAEVQSQKLKDGSWSFTCELSMDECIRRVQEQCRNQRYRILEGTSETRLRDAPPFEKAYHTSRLHLTCTDDGANVLLSSDKPQAEPGKSEAAAPACSAGETRTCVGAGACKGGQACLPDGKGFGACDCGPSGAAPGAAPAAEGQPASTPADAVTPPAANSGQPQNPAAK
jgi:hypothetical protein